MSKIDTRNSDFSSGILSTEHLVRYAGFLKNLKYCDISTIEKLLDELNQIDLNNKREKRVSFENFVMEKIYITDLYEKGENVSQIAKENTDRTLNSSKVIFLYHILLANEEFRKNNIEIEGMENLITDINNKKGAVLAYLHWGPFQVLFSLMITQLKKNLYLIAHEEALNFQKKVIDAYLDGFKEYANYIPVEYDIVTKGVKALRNNNIVCLLPEVNGNGETNRNGLQKDFLGTKINVPEGAAALAAYGQSPLYVATIDEKPGNKLFIRIKKITDRVEKNREDIKIHTSNMWEYIEKIVRNNPSSWSGWEIFDRIQGHTQRDYF